MTYSSYIEACEKLKRELIESLPTKNVNELRKDCTNLGIEGWINWIGLNFDEILKYVSASPSRRAQTKKWNQRIVRERLVLASIQHLGHAYIFLTAIDKYFVWQGLSYREVSAGAGSAYIDVHNSKISLWPFDDPDPFENDS